MKYSLKLAAVGLCLVASAAYSQTTVTINPQNVTISLTGFAGNDSGASPFKIATKDVISAMGLNPSGAKLQAGMVGVSVGPLVSSNLVWVVTTGTSNNKTNVDVTRFFSADLNGAMLTKGNTDYQITLLGFGEDTSGNVLTNGLGLPLSRLTFLVQGYSTVQNSGAFNSNVNGPGNNGLTTNLVLKGTVNASAPSKKTITFTPITR